ncbi:hypothetical protein Acy02nite_08800 [Actinoplanes cyaneus]|uniref:Lipoprotein n=1 Tax=Actinoplanes cyaneus TaxID=52696 RepID=A0A919ICH2_9ACTN|nr:hypothetical protein [Actinoplanes cyaneus]MCW2135639.1 hypothetical protein [Actinoplanes cyaneus]GID62999.1 hypothetical protein Acy02nite_08800 [Actinoplanes cyaneus]
MQPTPRRALRLTTALASACALTGCAALTSTTVTPAPTSTATPGPTSTFVQTAPPADTSPPTLANTGSTLPTVVASLIKYGQWLLANPDPDRVANVAAPGCAASKDLIRQTRSLVDQGARLTTVLPTVTAVQWPSPALSASTAPLGDQAVVTIRASRPAEAVTMRTAGEDTTVLSYLPALKSTTVRISLFRGTDKKWRFCEVTTPADAAVADSVTALL